MVLNGRSLCCLLTGLFLLLVAVPFGAQSNWILRGIAFGLLAAALFVIRAARALSLYEDGLEPPQETRLGTFALRVWFFFADREEPVVVARRAAPMILGALVALALLGFVHGFIGSGDWMHVAGYNGPAAASSQGGPRIPHFGGFELPSTAKGVQQ